MEKNKTEQTEEKCVLYFQYNVQLTVGLSCNKTLSVYGNTDNQEVVLKTFLTKQGGWKMEDNFCQV